MLDDMIGRVYEFAFPMYAVAATRYRAIADPANPERHAPNTLWHQRKLSDHLSTWITTPNNDTLYSNAWIDLSAGPVRLRLLPMPAGRYWSLAFMDACTDHFAVVGSRTVGAGPVDLTLVGPEHELPALASRVVRSPGQDVWLFARWSADGALDRGVARTMQDGLSIDAPQPGPAPVFVKPTVATDPANFLAVVNEVLGRNPPGALQAERIAPWREVGLCPGARDAWAQLDKRVQSRWLDLIDGAYADLAKAGSRHRREIQGWVTSGPEIGNFGDNHARRASVALGGLGALPPHEALYFVRFHDDAKLPLDGRQRYRLRIPAQGIPARAFWSLSMYQPVEGRRYFVDNPIGRYAIGNRTPGLHFNADGSIDIALQHVVPNEASVLANWLPAPQGPFQLSLRAYDPEAALRDGLCAMPTLERVISSPR